MRNLWLFFLRFQTFFLFLLFETVAFLLLIQNNNYQKSTVLNSSNAVIGRLYAFSGNIGSYLSLTSVNDSLAAENARLRAVLPSSLFSDTAAITFSIDTLYKGNSNVVREYIYITAKVVNNSVQYRNNYLTLNRGSLHGVESGMGVICGQGVVGIVRDVSQHFCTVVSLLHKDMRISAKLDSSGAIGSIVWDGKNPTLANLREVPSHVQLSVGETVSTTGYSLFPEGISVGTVIRPARHLGEDLLDIDIKLSTPFQSLNYVYIVLDKFAKEKKELESQLKR